MFDRHDRWWVLARIIIYVILIIALLAAVITSIILAINRQDGLLILYTIPALIVCLVAWVIAELFLGFLLDVKLIRNKLYDEEGIAFKNVINGDRKVKGATSKKGILREKKIEKEVTPKKEILREKKIEKEATSKQAILREEKKEHRDSKITKNGYYDPYDE